LLKGGAPNAKVLELASQSHLSLLTTLGDTFGYSAFEGMMCRTPVIATATGALPEFINDQNGVLLPLEVNRDLEWKHTSSPGRDTPAFEKIFTDTIEDLAEGAFAACVDLLNDPRRLASMRKAARITAEEKFNADDANVFWDQLYLDAVERR
jgi:glycosyltransferase involved in cell wall biosynthesis